MSQVALSFLHIIVFKCWYRLHTSDSDVFRRLRTSESESNDDCHNSILTIYGIVLFNPLQHLHPVRPICVIIDNTARYMFLFFLLFDCISTFFLCPSQSPHHQSSLAAPTYLPTSFAKIDFPVFPQILHPFFSIFFFVGL